MWGLPPHVRHFPGSNPVSVEEKDLARLREGDFLVSLKTDGTRFLLMMTLRPNSAEPIAIMVDRAQNMYEVEVWADEDYFTKGTLLDGELVWDQTRKDSLLFIVFDCLVMEGQRCLHLTYRERLSILHKAVFIFPPCSSLSSSEGEEGRRMSDEEVERIVLEQKKIVARNNDHNLTLSVKACAPFSQVRTVWEKRFLCSHRNDGLVFTNNRTHVETGTATGIFKWKPNHSVDVNIVFEEGRPNRVLANENSSAGEVDLVDVGGIPVRLVENPLLLAMKERAEGGCILECEILLLDGPDREERRIELHPERERPDKKAANTMRTISSTVVNAREKLSIDDIACSCSS